MGIARKAGVGLRTLDVRSVGGGRMTGWTGRAASGSDEAPVRTAGPFATVTASRICPSAAPSGVQEPHVVLPQSDPLGLDPQPDRPGWLTESRCRSCPGSSTASGGAWDPSPGAAHPRSSTMRVLIADDSSSLRLLVRRILDGHEVVEAGSGSEALDVLRAAPVDVAILDVSMPDGNGLDVCRAIRRDPSHPATVVIVITANGAMEAEQQALDAGADAFLAKPFSPRQLAVLINATTPGTLSRLTT